MKPLERPEVMAWWALSQSDARAARALLELDPPECHLVCFLAQQSAEKALKALLEVHDLPVPRVHDLVALARRLPEPLPSSALVDAVAELSDFGVGPRYPHPAGKASAADARAALAAAVLVCAWAERRLAAE